VGEAHQLLRRRLRPEAALGVPAKTSVLPDGLGLRIIRLAADWAVVPVETEVVAGAILHPSGVFWVEWGIGQLMYQGVILEGGYFLTAVG